MESSEDRVRHIVELRKMFSPEELKAIFQVDSIPEAAVKDTSSLPSKPTTTEPVVLASTEKHTKVVPKSKPRREAVFEVENEHGNAQHNNTSNDEVDDMSDGNHSAATDSWTEEAPTTPKKKKSAKKHTPETPRTKTHRDRVEKTPSTSKAMSKMVISSPLLGAAAKRKSITTPKRIARTQQPQTSPKTVSLQKLSNKIQKVTSGPRRFVVGIDFGTTFTSVSYFAHPIGEHNPRAFPDDVKVIMNWPRDGMGGARRQVPTECWYPSIPRKRPDVENQFEPTSFNNVVEWWEGSDDEENPSSQAVMPSNNEDIDMDDEHSTTFLWGYDVPYQRFQAHTTRDEKRLIARPKLMLVRNSQSSHTENDRLQLRPRLNALIEQGLIRKFAHKDKESARDVQDVMSDFLTEVLRHTKQQLIDNEHYTPDCKVAFAVTHPVVWDAGSSRVLEFALAIAVEQSEFGPLSYGIVDDLSYYTEPEAAATYLFGHSHDMLVGETFIVLDCGGGTVDCVTYTITREYPLRLKQEVDDPSGDSCGASYLNDNYENLLLRRLAGEKYLERNGETIESIVRALIPNFEDYGKRNKDTARKPKSRIKISGLRSDQDRGLTGASPKGFETNMLIVSSNDYNEIFDPLLGRVGDVLWKQVDKATTDSKIVKKVFLIGGFGACPSLQSYLQTFLKDTAAVGYEISLITTSDQESLTAVSSGAVLRALNKSDGPERKARCSYGFMTIQPYEADFEGHKNADIEVDPFDGKEYVRVINYFMLKGEKLDPIERFGPFESCHTFKLDEILLCEEEVHVSYLNVDRDSDDEPLKSNFHIKHRYNRDIKVAGKSKVDLSYLRDEGRILPVLPKPDNDGVVHGKAYWKVKYDIVVIVQGLNLTYELKFPCGPGGKVLKTGRISLASAFSPGTC